MNQCTTFIYSDIKLQCTEFSTETQHLHNLCSKISPVTPRWSTFKFWQCEWAVS